jgi:hypothetical protein
MSEPISSANLKVRVFQGFTDRQLEKEMQDWIDALPAKEILQTKYAVAPSADARWNIYSVFMLYREQK